MASVVLPAREWTVACEELTEQVGPDDELLIVCDRPDDPVRDAAVPPAEVVVAGEPEGCSGKSNALAAGLERASQDLIICTDDDFAHGGGWLDRVKSLAAEHRVVSTVPVLVSEGRFSRLFEGSGALFGLLTLRTGATVWGGTLAFRREDLDLDAAIRDLRRTVSDDALLATRLPEPHMSRELVREVPVEGTIEDHLRRSIRWTLTGRYLDPSGLALSFGVSFAVLLATLLAPAITAVVATAAGGLAFARLGVRRRTFLWTLPGFLLGLPIGLYSLFRPTFRWGRRRYRWEGLYDVTVLERDL